MFDVDVDLSGTPKKAFQQALAAVSQQQRNVLEEMARRAFRLGAKRDAIQALDAVIDGQIEVDLGDGQRNIVTRPVSVIFWSCSVRNLRWRERSARGFRH